MPRKQSNVEDEKDLEVDSGPESEVIDEEPEIELKADFSKMLWGDLALLDQLQNGTGSLGEYTVMDVRAFLNRVIIGGVDHLPIMDFGKIARALTAMTSSELSGANRGN